MLTTLPNADWVIQMVMPVSDAGRSGRLCYLPWAGYSRPMTGDRALWALGQCEALWPGYEFRAHPLDDDGRYALPGQSPGWLHPSGL